jgi:hypothetical protein
MSLISHYKLLDIKDILQLLKEICIQLENENIKMDLTIIGGATMLYYFPNHITHRTQDIDAIFNNQELIQRNADAIRES